MFLCSADWSVSPQRRAIGAGFAAQRRTEQFSREQHWTGQGGRLPDTQAILDAVNQQDAAFTCSKSQQFSGCSNGSYFGGTRKSTRTHIILRGTPQRNQ